ncbi:MAG TPA: hypothetical protein VKB18_03200 [Gemmatimonadota bacterium]|nr:hypothetical protein [Gemmatimonadota bacterium]
MSIDDLRDQGVLLPEEEWGEHRLETTVHVVPLAAGFAVAVASLAVIYLGDGGILTWVGSGVFLLALYAVTWMCDRAVLRQRERFREERRHAGSHEEEGEEPAH